jgi:hypothetical protein
MVAKDCPLLCAVIHDYPKPLNTLLKEGRGVNVLDKGGRTFMHQIAALDFIVWNQIIYNSEYKFSLDITDSVLQWTPLQYAIKLEKLYTVERLLGGNVDRSGLDMIRQRAHDQSYIDSIIEAAEIASLCLLLDFLCSIV